MTTKKFKFTVEIETIGWFIIFILSEWFTLEALFHLNPFEGVIMAYFLGMSMTMFYQNLDKMANRKWRIPK